MIIVVFIHETMQKHLLTGSDGWVTLMEVQASTLPTDAVSVPINN